MSQKVADYLKHESIKLRFTTSNANGTPKSILKRSLNQTISDIMQPTAYNGSPSTIIFYERLDVSIVELETKRSLKISWTGIHNKEEASCNVATISFFGYELTSSTGAITLLIAQDEHGPRPRRSNCTSSDFVATWVRKGPCL